MILAVCQGRHGVHVPLLVKHKNCILLFHPAAGLLPFSQSSVKVTDTWISQSNSTNQKRRLLAVTGKSLVVVGVQVGKPLLGFKV